MRANEADSRRRHVGVVVEQDQRHPDEARLAQREAVVTRLSRPGAQAITDGDDALEELCRGSAGQGREVGAIAAAANQQSRMA